MYPNNYIPRGEIYRNDNNYQMYENYPYQNDERFFLAPFLVGGLAGTALGYGIANNNQPNNSNCCPGMVYPIYQTPYYYPYQNQYPYQSTSTNNYYY